MADGEVPLLHVLANVATKRVTGTEPMAMFHYVFVPPLEFRRLSAPYRTKYVGVELTFSNSYWPFGDGAA